MRTASNDTDLDEGSSLYDLIVDATGIEYPGEFTNPEDYKNHLVRYFGRMDQEEFDALAEDIRDWANEATGVFNDNRRTKEEKEPLPEIEGMPEPPPPKARRARVAISDDDEEEVPPPPPTPIRRPRVVAAPPEDEDEDEPVEEAEEESEPEPEAAPPPRATRRRAPTPPPAPASQRKKRDPDAGRYAKVMPHYLRDREIDIPGLQAKIEKTDGANYSVTTLDRTLAACRSVVGWLERNGVDLHELSR